VRFYIKNLLLVVVLIFINLLFGNVQAALAEAPDIGLAIDPAPSEVNGKFRLGSHVKLFIPNLPYLAISHAINAALVRPVDNEKGWEYDLALSHHNVNDKIWEFKLRHNVRFQDGSLFNADSVLLNMTYFKKKPFLFSKLHEVFDRVEKVDDYTVRFYMTEPYGVFLHDAIWLQFYTPTYLEKFGWNGKPTCPNLAEPGPYGLGPYILSEGYIEGDRRAPKAILKANPLYWGDNKPKVEFITIYTDIGMLKARDQTLFSEGEVDITPIPFADQVETTLSPYAKLTVSPSKNNYAMHLNMLNGNPAIRDERIRYVVNHAIDQEYMLNLSMLGEGVLSPTMVSPNFYKVSESINRLEPFFKHYKKTQDDDTESLRSLVRSYQKENNQDPAQSLQLTLLAQKSFLFLIRDIKFFLAKVNIDLKVEALADEGQVFRQLFDTYQDKNQKPWDMLLWGNYDWYKHPWSAFFVYRPFNAWSTIPPNSELVSFTNRLMRTNVESEEYIPLVAGFIRHVYENNYMVFLPTPNNIYAVNKEVVFEPGSSAFVSLRDLQVTDLHWSLRGDKPYPKERKIPLRIYRKNFKVSMP